MARVRSPAYPNAALPDVIDFARKIYDEERRNPVARDVAVIHMGFSGATGSSDRAISALFHFGLAEKVAKGELRVTDLAVDLLHPDSPTERRRAMREAAFSPDLFKELRERYAGDPPSLAALGSYLSRQGFAQAAIGPASRAYLETCYYLQREGAYKSESVSDPDEAGSTPIMQREESPPMHVQAAPVSVSPPSPMPTELDLNEPQFDIRGGTIRVEALVDYEGLTLLEEQIRGLRAVLDAKGKRAGAKTGGAPSATPTEKPSDS